MTFSRLHKLHAAGQSVWLDNIDRTMLVDGSLARQIAADALVGQTSNPTIFEKALAQGTAYDAQLAAAPDHLTTGQLFELVASDDVRAACDLFRGVYESSGGVDGYVSIEVSPTVANDAQGTIEEAHRLWQLVNRPNVMIKVPGTDVNVTLLFAVDAYRRVIEAYLGGLEDRLAAGGDLRHVASVASFFISRVDSEVDARLDALIAQADDIGKSRLGALKGKAAIANAKLAYALFQKHFSGPRWDALRTQGAHVQRPLWASTSTKNPAYRDVVYVEQLVGPDTVNTMPPATIVAFQDHGEVARTVDAGVDTARALMQTLASEGISMTAVTDKLLLEGLASFQKSFDTLLGGLETKLRSLGRAPVATV
ncbi:MAG: transaldolase [Gemmatimonadaceae bacterium]|nr:transaldolase [Gemmatimonadaceae bacterium]